MTKLVPGARLELARAYTRWILSPLRLPIPPSRHEEVLIKRKSVFVKKNFQVLFAFFIRFRTAFFPQLHFTHFFSSFPLQFFADKGACLFMPHFSR